MKMFEVQLSCYMVEIYKGELRDLLLAKNVKERPKLDVRYNKEDGMVVIKNVMFNNLNNME